MRATVADVVVVSTFSVSSVITSLRAKHLKLSVNKGVVTVLVVEIAKRKGVLVIASEVLLSVLIDVEQVKTTPGSSTLLEGIVSKVL